MPRFTTRQLTSMAILAAIQVVLARFVPMPEVTMRFSIEAVPIILAGILFGPFSGALVGFVGDFIGAQFSGYGYNPIFALPPILVGLCAGLLRFLVIRKAGFGRILLSFLPAILLGNVIWQSYWLSYFYGLTESMRQFELWPVVRFLTERFHVPVATACQIVFRSIQFAITSVIDAALLYGMFKTGMFKSLGLWPPHSPSGKNVSAIPSQDK